jgi:hypothetical protein
MSSTLDPDNMPRRDRRLGEGHGTDALGPSNASDSGSDVQAGLRSTGEVDIGLGTGTNDDPDSAAHDPTAGPSIGDAYLDSDTDAGGTGERAAAGRDTDIEAAPADIDVDRIEDPNAEQDLGDQAEPGDLDGTMPPPRQPGTAPSQRR